MSGTPPPAPSSPPGQNSNGSSSGSGAAPMSFSSSGSSPGRLNFVGAFSSSSSEGSGSQERSPPHYCPFHAAQLQGIGSPEFFQSNQAQAWDGSSGSLNMNLNEFPVTDSSSSSEPPASVHQANPYGPTRYNVTVETRVKIQAQPAGHVNSGAGNIQHEATVSTSFSFDLSQLADRLSEMSLISRNARN